MRKEQLNLEESLVEADKMREALGEKTPEEKYKRTYSYQEYADAWKKIAKADIFELGQKPEHPFEYVPASSDSEAIKHIKRHFEYFEYGSQFLPDNGYFDSPEAVLRFVDEKLKSASSGERVVLQFEAPKPIGEDAITEVQEDDDVRIQYRDARTPREAQINVVDRTKRPETHILTIIGGPYGSTGKWGFYTAFPGELAPRLITKERTQAHKENPSQDPSFEDDEKFWESHAFIYSDLKYTSIIHNDARNIDKLTDWTIREIEELVEQRGSYMAGFHYEDHLVKMAELIAEKNGTDILSKEIIADYKSKTEYNEYDEGTEYGSVTFMNLKILDYIVNSDGYGMSITKWHDNNLQEAWRECLKHIVKNN